MEKLDRWSRYACFGCWRSVTLQMCYCDKHLVELLCFLLWWVWGLGTDPFNQATTPGGGHTQAFSPRKEHAVKAETKARGGTILLSWTGSQEQLRGIACWQQWFARDTRWQVLLHSLWHLPRLWQSIETVWAVGFKFHFKIFSLLIWEIERHRETSGEVKPLKYVLKHKLLYE